MQSRSLSEKIVAFPYFETTYLLHLVLTTSSIQFDSLNMVVETIRLENISNQDHINFHVSISLSTPH